MIWYTLLTILLRCPAAPELCDDSSPRLCKPYFQIKTVVTPYLQPYYHAYAAPYVDVAKPYYDRVDRTILVPTRAFAAVYGAPRLAQARALGRAQWEKSVQPQLAKYQGIAKLHYNQSLEPHVNRTAAAIAPYYDIARTSALQTYHEIILPSYFFAQPYLAKSYVVASAFTTETAIPSAYWTWTKIYAFLDGTVWPQIRVVYIDNVEPQLMRIGQRLGRYKERASATPESTTAP